MTSETTEPAIPVSTTVGTTCSQTVLKTAHILTQIFEIFTEYYRHPAVYSVHQTRVPLLSPTRCINLQPYICAPGRQKKAPNLLPGNRRYIHCAGCDCIGVARKFTVGSALALSVLQDSRVLCRNVLPKQRNLTFIQLQIEIPIALAVFS